MAPLNFFLGFLTFFVAFGYSSPQAKEHCIAKVQTVYDPNKKFFGADAAITIHKPIVQSNQWTSSRIKLINGVDSIEAGWMINPSLFKDDEAHFYARFSANGEGCINMDCSGFVHVAPNIPLGMLTSGYSTVEQQVLWNVSIDKREDDGNWWLSINSARHQVGYWPKTLFTSLAEFANQVEFGGEINDPSATNPPPSMGNGLKAAFDTRLSSYFMHATVVDESFNNVSPSDTEEVADCNELYTAVDGGYQDDRPDVGRLIFYGGPGSVIR